jgi:hypothetical protein
MEDIRTYFLKVDSEQRYICVKTKQPSMKQMTMDAYFKTNESKVQKEHRVTKCFGYNPETKCWHCGECGANMGEDNSRQVCGKYMCLGYGY